MVDLLNRDVWQLILSHLSLADLCRVARCSRAMRDVAFSPLLWSWKAKALLPPEQLAALRAREHRPIGVLPVDWFGECCSMLRSCGNARLRELSTDTEYPRLCARATEAFSCHVSSPPAIPRSLHEWHSALLPNGLRLLSTHRATSTGRFGYRRGLGLSDESLLLFFDDQLFHLPVRVAVLSLLVSLRRSQSRHWPSSCFSPFFFSR